MPPGLDLPWLDPGEGVWLVRSRQDHLSLRHPPCGADEGSVQTMLIGEQQEGLEK